MTRIYAAIALATFIAAPAPASKKPCRDAQGRIAPCPKPKPAATPRCKDAQGRFREVRHTGG